MSMTTRSFVRTYVTYPGEYPGDQWQGRSGKASWLPAHGPEFYTSGRVAGVPHGGAQWMEPVKPHLMMDPSDPSTWMRPYVFTR